MIESSDIQSEEVSAPTETTESMCIDISKQTYKELTRIKEKNDCNNFDDVINGIIEALKDYQDNSESKGSDEKWVKQRLTQRISRWPERNIISIVMIK